MILELRTIIRYFGQRWYVFVLAGCLILFGLYVYGGSTAIVGQEDSETKPLTAAQIQGPYGEDTRLIFTGCESFDYGDAESPLNDYIYNWHMGIFYRYDEKTISEAAHASFDGQNRMTYMLGYSKTNILSGKNSYCEENVFEWDDEADTCRHIYYKSTGVPYNGGYYVGHRYMFDVSNYSFTKDNKILKIIEYSRNVGSDIYGYSEELFFSRGYQADYVGERLMSELQYYDYWGTNETGVWEYRVYQYDEYGNCICRVVTTEDEIRLYAFEHDSDNKSVKVYQYLVKEDWELPYDDGSIIYFSPVWGNPAVRYVMNDGTVKQELFYGKAMDMGQQHYLMPDEVEDTVMDHKYEVKPADCLWSIARRYYGSGTQYQLIYMLNRGSIGGDPSRIEPGTMLFIPEIGNAVDTR